MWWAGVDLPLGRGMKIFLIISAIASSILIYLNLKKWGILP